MSVASHLFRLSQADLRLMTGFPMLHTDNCIIVLVIMCRAAYKRMVLAAHPDKGGSVEAFERMQHAYCLLTAMTNT